MADASCCDVPLVERTSEAAAATLPLPANLGMLVEDLHTSLVSPSKLQPKHDGPVSITTRPANIVVPESRYPPSQLHSFATKHPSSPLSVLSAAAFSLKDKTHQVAQHQKRALSAFQQKGGLVGWLHGESDDHAASPTTSQTYLNSAPCTPPSSRSSIETLMTKQPVVEKFADRQRSMPNIGPGFMFDNPLDKVVQPFSSQPLEVSTQGHSREHAELAGSPLPRPNTSDFHRQRAATTDSPRRSTVNDSSIDDESTPPALLKAQSAAPLHSPRLAPETRFSLDEILSDEWSSCVLWAHLYSSGRDPQHHLRLSFLIETTFRITPLYRSLVAADDTCSDKQENLEKLVTRLKILHSRYLKRNGAASLATSGVPVASPAAIHAKNQLALMVQTLTDQNLRDDELVVGAQVEKTVSSLLQLAREVDRELRVLGTRSYINFADSMLYRDFIAREPGFRNIAVLLRAARIPFYQQPNSLTDTVSLNSLVTENEATTTVFSRAECQAFEIVAQSEGSIKFTDISPGVNADNSTAEAIAIHAVLQQTIVPFLNPAGNVHPAASKPLAFNFTAGTGSNTFYGAVMWLPVDLTNGTEEMANGFCIISKFPLIDTMRHFLRSLWKRLGDKTEINDVAILPEAVVKSSQDMGKYFLQRETSVEHPGDDLVPRIDFRLADLFDCLSLTNILRLFAFVLLEKKIVLVASSYTVLFSVTEALRALIYPLVWSHVYVPVLPLALKDCLQCPTPFIFGLHDSYVRRSDMPRPSSDLVVVNLDRDSLTGGGDIFLPPVRQSMLREELFRICKPHLFSRDSVDNFAADSKITQVFPSTAVRRLFFKHMCEILALLDPCFSRFDLDGQCISVVDNAHSSQWPADTARFCSTLLHTQAISTYLAAPQSTKR